MNPTRGPTPFPTETEVPTKEPTSDPTIEPTVNPVIIPSTSIPSNDPTSDPIVPTISVSANQNGDDNLGANGAGNEDAATAEDGFIPGTNTTISVLILVGAAILFLAFAALGFAYYYDRSKKAKNMRTIERNISGGYGVGMVASQSPSGDGKLTLPSYD